MSTTIAIENQDGTISAIYCHSDGKLNSNDVILVNHYNDTNKIEELIALGNISFLGKNVAPSEGVTHTWDSPDNNTALAYARDRGDELDEARTYESLNEFRHSPDGNLDYVYLWSGLHWFRVSKQGLRPLLSL